jgi:hypothetical protein
VRCLTHRLGPADEYRLRLAQDDLLRSLDHGFKARSAEAIHGEGRRVDWQTGPKPDMTCQVDGVRGSLEDIAKNYVLDLARVDAAPGDRGPPGNRAQISGRELLQGSPE